MDVKTAPEAEMTRMQAWLRLIQSTGCFLVSGEKRHHVIPKPDCKACMASRALKGEEIPKTKKEAEV